MADVTAAEIEQALDGLRVVIKDWRPLEKNPDMATGTVANPHGFAAELKRLIDSYPDFGPDGPPLTCDGCKHAPAALLAVMSRTNADRTPAPGRVMRLLCRDCAGRTREICERGGRAVMFLAVADLESEDEDDDR